MKTVVKNTLIILILACSCSNFGHAFDIDETVDDEIRKNYNINIIGVKLNGKTNVTVTPHTLLTEDKTLLVIGEDRALQKCFQI